jgi:hypothetical protein
MKGEKHVSAQPNRKQRRVAQGQPRAFISYSHRDKAFALALAQRLREHGVWVWIDIEGVLVGDLVIRRVGDAIHEEPFVIAVISEHSVNSPWCLKEWTLAVALGIQYEQVKVLPVRLDEAVVPSFLADTRWADAKRSDCRAVAAELATAINDHLGRRHGAAVAISSVGADDGRLEDRIDAHAALQGDVGSFEFWYGLLERYVRARERQRWHLAA